MILPSSAFAALVLGAVAVTAAVPVILLILLFRDLKKGSSW